MHGSDSYRESLFTTVELEDFVPAKRPLRPIRTGVNGTLAKLDAKFLAMYEVNVKGGHRSFAPEKLRRAMLLQVLNRVGSQRQLVEQIQNSLLFRWFVGLPLGAAVWNHSVFSKNRERLIDHDAVNEPFNATVEMANQCGLLSGERVSVDDPLVQTWAGRRSMRRKDRSDDGRPPEDWCDQGVEVAAMTQVLNPPSPANGRRPLPIHRRRPRHARMRPEESASRYRVDCRVAAVSLPAMTSGVAEVEFRTSTGQELTHETACKY